MKHSGKARKAAFRLILISLIAVLAVYAIIGFSVAAAAIITAVAVPSLLLVLPLAWITFSVFTLYFFRDPEPQSPTGANLILSPAHGKVDVIDTTTEPQFMGGECQR